MKYLFKVHVLLALSPLLAACGSSIGPAPLSINAPAPTVTFSPSPAATGVNEREVLPIPSQTPIATQSHGLPTLIPTIDPSLVPELLGEAFTVQNMEGVNGHSTQKITGWDHGFGGGYWWYSCPGFVQLDDTHFLLYLAAGQVDGPEGYWIGVDTVPQPVVIDLESGSVWQPPVKQLDSPENCNIVHWSENLELLITTRLKNANPIISTYKMDGSRVADYQGNLSDISPSGEKILIDGDTLVDLRTNTRISLAWPSYEGDYPRSSDYYWTFPDETRVYHCCFYYADRSNNKSFRFRITEDWQLADVNTMEEAYSPSSVLPFMKGEWVRDNQFFLVHWNWVDDGDIRYLPMIDPGKRVIYDVQEKAGVPPDLTCPESTVSNTGSYVWLECYDRNYLIDLYTFEGKEYPGLFNMEVGWPADDQFVWLRSAESQDSKQYYVVSTASKELKPLPIKALSFDGADLWWHPKKNMFAYISEDGQKLGLMDAQTLSVQEKDLPSIFNAFYWSPTGERIALVAEDGSVWQIDYPARGNPEQLTPPVSSVKDLSWSPDGSSLSFVGGPDIYIVDTAQ
jgi:hypothetical protein